MLFVKKQHFWKNIKKLFFILCNINSGININKIYNPTVSKFWHCGRQK
jgi:hypothetical protein